jgi:hypothetical protein
VTAVVERVWQDPRFPQLMSAAPQFARPYRLMYGALAPPAVAGARHVDGLSQLVDYVAARNRSPFGRLEARYFADLAGVRHQMESYLDLYQSSVLGDAAPRVPVAEMDVCSVAHTIFHLTHFGTRDPGLPPGDLARVQRVVGDLAEHAARGEEWENIAKLLLVQYCLGGDPASTESGRAAIAVLARAQRPDGAIPGPALARRAADSATPVQYFRKAYQATLTTTLMTVILSARGTRPAGQARPASGFTNAEPVANHLPSAWS